MPNRRGVEFNERTKRQERRRFWQKNPDKQDVKPEVHHILNVKYGKKYGVPNEALKSQQNAVAVDPEFHREIHEKQDEETQEELANWFLSVYRKLF